MTAYTPEQLRAIDAQVAQVMGVAEFDSEIGEQTSGYVVHYTTSIAHAWRCVDYMRERGWRYWLYDTEDGHKASFWRPSVAYLMGTSVEPTVQLAICLAFLAANGVEVQA